MGLRDLIDKLHGKVYRFELQECTGRGGKGGWTTIATVDKFGKPATFVEYFKPGCIYRLMARDLETGQYAKRRWKHFEPSFEIEKVEREREKREKQPRMPSPAEIMTAWAEGLEQQMQPVIAFGKVMQGIRQVFSEAFPTPQGGGIPPPEFEGKLPSFMHPYVVKEIGATVNSVTDHFFGKLDEFRQKAMAHPPTTETQAEPVQFPDIEEYMPEETPLPPTPKPETVKEEKLEEKEVETVEEEKESETESGGEEEK